MTRHSSIKASTPGSTNRSTIGGPLCKLTQLSPESSCVQRWATRLQLTAPEYLEQLEAAIQLSAQHSAHSKENRRQDAAAADSGRTKNASKTAPQSEGPEHVFEISSGTLAWKQYFAQKNVHGKRGAIPLVQETISSAAWCMLREAAHKQRETLQQLQRLEQHNQTLIKERESAAAVAQKGVILLEQFRKQTYDKFCHLLNTKKRKIRELTQQLKGSNPVSVTAPVSGIVALPSTSAGEPAPKRGNVRVVSGRGKRSTTTIARAGLNTHDDDGDYDDDTDVDDNLQDEDECNTDEEKEMNAEKRVNAPKSKLCGVSGGPLSSTSAAASNTKLPTRTYDTKVNCQGGTSSSTSKRKEMDNCASNLTNSKRSNVFDSQDDLFNMSQEEARESLLSNIRPRNTGSEVSNKATSHFIDTKFPVVASPRSHLSSTLALNSGAKAGSSKSLAYGGSDAAAASGRACKRDQETVSFVASLLQRNVKERQAKGYRMPTRLDDFDLAGKHLDIDFLRKDSLSYESTTHTRGGYSASNIVPSLTGAGIRQCAPSDESDQEHQRDFFDEASSEEVPLSPNKTRSQGNGTFSNTSGNIPGSSFLQNNQRRLAECSSSKADVEMIDQITSTSVDGTDQLSNTSSLVKSTTAEPDKLIMTSITKSSVSHDNIGVHQQAEGTAGDGSQLSDYDKLTEIIGVDNCSLGSNLTRHIKSLNPNIKVAEQSYSKDQNNGTGLASTNADVLSAITGNVFDDTTSSGQCNADDPHQSAMKSSDKRDLVGKKPAPKRSVETSSVATSDYTKTSETKRIRPDSDDLSFHQFRVGSIIEDVFM